MNLQTRERKAVSLYAWCCLVGSFPSNARVCIVTGPRIDLEHLLPTYVKVEALSFGLGHVGSPYTESSHTQAMKRIIFKAVFLDLRYVRQ
jgi:hypothetical protein